MSAAGENDAAPLVSGGVRARDGTPAWVAVKVGSGSYIPDAFEWEVLKVKDPFAWLMELREDSTFGPLYDGRTAAQCDATMYCIEQDAAERALAKADFATLAALEADAEREDRAQPLLTGRRTLGELALELGVSSTHALLLRVDVHAATGGAASASSSAAGGAGSGGSGTGGAAAGGAAAASGMPLPSVIPVPTCSPSASAAGGSEHLTTRFAWVSTAPVWPEYPAIKAWRAASRQFGSAAARLLRLPSVPQQLTDDQAGDILVEATGYHEAEATHPGWVVVNMPRAERATVTATLSTIYDAPGKYDASGIAEGAMTLDLTSRPEVALRVREAGLLMAPWSFEAKTVNMRMWEGGLYRCYAGMRHSYFMGGFAGKVVFHSKPPLGYVAYTAGCVVIICLAELAGRLFLTPIMRPLFYGSDEWRDAADGLDATPGGEAASFVLDTSQAIWTSNLAASSSAASTTLPTGNDSQTRVFWTAQPYKQPGGAGDDLFIKVIDWDAYRPELTRQMVQTYAHLQRNYHDRLPASLVPASLHFGDGRLLVRAPFVKDSAPFPDGALATADQQVADAVADALVWMTRHDVLYIDLRGPNVLQCRASSAAASASSAAALPAAVLIDYDDAKYVPGLWSQLVAAADEEAAVEIVAAWFRYARRYCDWCVFTDASQQPKIAASFKQKLGQAIVAARAAAAAPAAEEH